MAPDQPKFGAAARCAVAGPVAWTVAFATFLFTAEMVDLTTLLGALGNPRVPLTLFGTLGLLGGFIGGGRGRALSSLAAGFVVGGLAVLMVAHAPSPVLAVAFPIVAGPIMGIGYSLGARSGRKVSKGLFAGLFAGFSTTLLVFLLYGVGAAVFMSAWLPFYLGGLVTGYVATLVFFIFYSVRTPKPLRIGPRLGVRPNGRGPNGRRNGLGGPKPGA